MTQPATSEFDLIKDCVIYFDWNVISYLRGLTEITDPVLKKQCVELDRIIAHTINRDRCVFPYTIAHFLDIRQGSQELKLSKIDQLKQFTRAWTYQEDVAHDFVLRLDKCIDMRKHFTWYDASVTASEAATQADETLAPLLDAASNMLKGFASAMPNEQWAGFLARLANSMGTLNSGLETLRLNKEMRHAKSPVEGLRIKFPQIDPRSLADRSANIKSIVDDAISESIFPFKTADDYFAMINPHRISILSPFENEVLRLSGLSDFLGVSSEKSKKDTAFTSVTTDIKHMVFGLRSHILISHDANFRKKAGFIASWLGLGTPILDISDFVELFAK